MVSLRRLTAAFLLAFGAATAITGYATYSASQNAIVTLVDRRIDAVSRALLGEARPGDAGAILARIHAFSHRRETGDIGFSLVDGAGRRLGGNVTLDRPVPPGFSTVHHVDGITGLPAGRVQSRGAGGGLTLLTIAETEPIDGYAAVRLRNYLLGFGAIAAIVLAGVASFSLLIRRRIGEVRRTAEAIIDGDLARRIPVDPRGGAFSAQAETFNRMLDRIGTLVEGLRNVSSDVAHDLRTPLARLHHRIERAAADAPTPAAQAELEGALTECEALLAMFAAILRITEVEGGDRRANFAAIDPAALAIEIADTLAVAAADSGHRLHVGARDAGRIEGDRQLVSQALMNLVENALHHTPPGSTITIAAERQGPAMVLSVTDDGPGIAAADRARALRRFGRLDASRNRPGHGLGLTLVEAIARLHRGTLTLDDAQPGLIVALRLPLIEP